MGKLYVPSTARTRLDHVREALHEAERAIFDMADAGPQAMELLHVFDYVAQELDQLEEQDVDVRVERAHFETLQRRLDHRKRRFLNQASRLLEEERARIEPAQAHWWWYLDEAAVMQRRRRLRRVVMGAAAAILLLTGAWLAYQEFLAPPPEVSEAFRRIEAGKSEFAEGNLQAALEAFDTATELRPEDPEPWLWKGVLHDQLGEPAQAGRAFAAAEPLYETSFDFVLNRGRVHLQAGQVEKARSDVKTAINLKPTSGWGYYLRAGTAAADRNYAAALADLEHASELARESADGRLQALVARQQAQLMQMQSIPTPE